MRKINDAIDRFCAMHPRLGIPNLMRYIVAANAAVYIFSMFDRSGMLLSVMCMDAGSLLRGQLWRLVTFVLIPTGDRPISVLLSLFFYFWLGESMERLWGSTKFTVYYAGGMLLSVIASMIALVLDGFSVPLYGAGYVNTALFFAYALTYPEAIVRIFYIIPVKMKWLAAIGAVVYALSVIGGIVAGLWGLALMPIVSLLNLFIFFSPDFHRRADQFQARHRSEAIQFRKAVKEQKKQRGYHHKCEVCGKTDTEFPNMQFRYCSKCSGYHCFCEEHIFNHTHHTE